MAGGARRAKADAAVPGVQRTAWSAGRSAAGLSAGRTDQLFECFQGLGADQCRFPDDEGRDAGDSPSAASGPVLINGCGKRPLFQGLAGRCGRQSTSPGQFDQSLRICQIGTVHKVRAKQHIMKRPAVGLRVGPRGQLLSSAAVEGHRAFAEWQSFLFHQSFHLLLGGRQIESAAGKQRLQGQTRFGSLGMQWECEVTNLDLVFLSQGFNTNRTEIAPRSDVVRTNL